MASVPSTRIGLVGCGGRGIGHVKSVQELNGAEWIGGCDLDVERRKAFEDETGLPSFEKFEDLLNESPDVIGVATNVQTHVPVGSLVLQAGIHLVVEKPLATTAAEGKSLVQLAAEKGLKAAVSFQLHYNSFAATMRDVCKEIDPLLINHARHSGVMPLQYLKPGMLTGCFDFLVHEIDLIRWWTGRQVEAATARIGCGVYSDSEAPDLAILHLDLSGDDYAAANVVASMGGSPLARNIQIAGKNGSLEARFGNELRRNTGPGTQTVNVEIPPDELNGTAALYRDLILSVHGEDVPDMPTLQDGLAANAIIEAAFQSHRENRRVEIDPDCR